MRRFLKLLHTLAAIGLTGAAGVHLLLLYAGPPAAPTAEFAAVRDALVLITSAVLLPSLVLVLISGLLAIAAHPPFGNLAWVWVKALLSLSIFQTTLMLVHSPVKDNADAAAQALAGEIDAAMLSEMLQDESGALWVVIVVCVLNIALAIWRPRRAWPIGRTVGGRPSEPEHPAAPSKNATEQNA